MNIPSQITLYDLLCMIVPGFVILWLLNFGGLQFDCSYEWPFVIILSYPIGMIYHRIIEHVFRCTKKYWGPCMMQAAWEEEAGKIKTQEQKPSKKECQSVFYKAYYLIAKNDCLMNIPILEAQEAFLRDAFLLFVLSTIKVCCSYCEACWHCSMIVLLVSLSLATAFVWLWTQKKIYCLVWEGYFYIKLLKDEENSSNNQPNS